MYFLPSAHAFGRTKVVSRCVRIRVGSTEKIYSEQRKKESKRIFISDAFPEDQRDWSFFCTDKKKEKNSAEEK